MKKFILICVFWGLQAAVAFGQVNPVTERLVAALQIKDLFDVMALEGMDYGNSLNEELLDGSGGASWNQTVQEIYRPSRVWAQFVQNFETNLAQYDTKSIVEFSESPLAVKIFKLEVSARRALLEDGVETASAQILKELREKDDPRLKLLKRFVEINDLVEFNVMGAMNANYAFYRGLMDGKMFADPLSDEQILKEVWDQEDSIRTEAGDWVYSYLALAYRPLTDAELATYIAFSESRAGRGLNTAIFAAFDTLYKDISYQLGLSVAASMNGDDI